MARPKKIEGAPAASLSGGTTTPDAGASTALASPAPEASSLDEKDAGVATEGVAEIAPTLPIASSTEATKEPLAEEVVPASRRGDGTTLPLPEEVTTLPAEQTEPPSVRIPGLPAEVTLDDLRDLGLPAPGTILTCALFETGKAEEGVVVSISVELDVVNAWLRNSKRMWPIPAARIDGAAWTHVNEDYPDPTASASFDRLHRSESAHPANVPPAWLIITTDAVLDVLSAQGKQGAVELSPLPSDSAASLAAQTKVLLGVPDHYSLCKITSLGTISGHGHRASDGKAMEEHAGGSMVYFPAATVRKLGHLLEVIEADDAEMS